MKLNDSGTLVVSDQDEGKTNAANPHTDNKPTPAVNTWRFANAEQLAAQCRGIDGATSDAGMNAAKRAEHPFNGMSKGDREALADRANELQKQIDS